MGKIYQLDKSYFQQPLDFEGIRVAQIGRLYCDENTTISEHIHKSFYELTIVTDGVGEIITNGMSTKVKRGDIYFNFPGDTHKIVSDSRDCLQYDYFAFNCEIPHINEKLHYIEEHYQNHNMRVFASEQIRGLVVSAIAELNEEKEDTAELLALIFKQIVLYAIRSFSGSDIKKSFKAISADVLCYKITNFIDENIYTIKNLSELSEVTNYSYGYISSVFKKHTNETIFEYYHKRKLDTAANLLLENRMKVSEVAEMLNYSSAYALSKAFTAYYGCSPRAYRNQVFKNTQ